MRGAMIWVFSLGRGQVLCVWRVGGEHTHPFLSPFPWHPRQRRMILRLACCRIAPGKEEKQGLPRPSAVDRLLSASISAHLRSSLPGAELDADAVQGT
jgi:hypothetical protein